MKEGPKYNSLFETSTGPNAIPQLDSWHFAGADPISPSWDWKTLRRILDFLETFDGSMREKRPPWIEPQCPLNPDVLNLPLHRELVLHKLPQIGEAPLPAKYPGKGFVDHRRLDAVRFMARAAHGLR